MLFLAFPLTFHIPSRTIITPFFICIHCFIEYKYYSNAAPFTKFRW